MANFEKHINFDFLTNEYLGIQKDANQQMENIKRIFGGDQPQDIILEGDYDYCYKTLLCEMKEFYVVFVLEIMNGRIMDDSSDSWICKIFI